MSEKMFFHVALLLWSVFVSSVSQVLLKKAAMRHYHSRIREYLNPLVLFAYALFFGTTLLNIYAYRVIPLSIGPLLEATGYLYVTAFGAAIFHETINRRKLYGMALIILGIIFFSV